MPATATSRREGLTTSVAVKAPVVVESASNLTLSGEQTVNSVACVEGDRVLVMGQTDPVDNGIYVVSEGAWSRALDFNGNLDVVCGTWVFVANIDAGVAYRVITPNPIVIGESELEFEVAGANDASLMTYNRGLDQTVNRTVQARLRDFTTIRDFGGGPDKSAAENNEAIGKVIDDVQGGQQVIFPRGEYDVSAEFVIQKAIRIKGEGADWALQAQGDFIGTRFNWVGAAAATMFEISTTVDYDNAFPEISNFSFYGGDAARALEVLSVRYGKFENLYFEHFSNACILVSASAIGGSCQYNRFENITVRNQQANGSAFTLSQVSGSNASFNTFKNIDIQHATGHGMDFGSSDNNYVENLRCFRTTSTGYPLIFRGGADAAATARNNYVHGFSSNVAARVEGTDVATTASYNNHITMIDADNATPEPTIGTGALCFLHYASGDFGPLQGHARAIFGETINATYLERALGAVGANHSLHIANDHDAHIRLVGDPGGTRPAWDIYIVDASGNMKISQVTGSGFLNLPNLGHTGSTLGFYATVPIAKQTGVAVSTAAIHAALVALGIFAA